MIKNLVLQRRSFIMKRFYSLKTSAENLKQFKHTVFLPKTDFPNNLSSDKVVERDERIQEDAKFLDYYNWQRENLKGEFVLHDGPPYANGRPHIGHAINKLDIGKIQLLEKELGKNHKRVKMNKKWRTEEDSKSIKESGTKKGGKYGQIEAKNFFYKLILKDIILRSQTVQGKRVHFMPGWDCHGLPIEIAALGDAKENLSAEKIRQQARQFAEKMASIQMDVFKQWGVMADWKNQCYFTYDTNYVVNQLQTFWKLLEKDLIYYDLKPVYWSPSSRTALAEAELIYQNHKSHSVYIRLNAVQNSYSEPLYLLVWTTTPWTLPLNKAVYCSPNIKYSVVKISSWPGLYVMAKELIQELQEKLKVEVTEQSEISSKELINLKYKHPWNPEQVLNVFESPKLKLSGTGLLHSVPGHGHEDYIMGLSNNLKVESFVDESGCYSANAGEKLAGLNVLKEGSDFVIEQLSSEILLKETIMHSYPYDWRNKTPVIIRASNQWFIDSEKLKDRAIKSLEKVKVPIKFFEEKLKNRPYWCLSRQRKWGVPIPAFFHKTSGRPFISKSLVHHLCQVIESSGPDVWWTESIETLFPRRFCDEFFVGMEDVRKGEDIMDIWFDSGISWSFALNGKKSELYLEGEDQYTGWFQSSLLTSVGIRNEAPFKKVMTHGFTVDESGKKMSKSLGNVVDPEEIARGKNAFGVDTLRWFVASHSHHSVIPVSSQILNGNHENIKKIRSIFRFILGAVSDVSEEHLKFCRELTNLDRSLLNSCYNLYHSTMDFYNAQEINKVCLKILNFVPNEVSSRYITVIKDRLYCDQVDSPRRRACQYTLNSILETLCYTIAPILPHLVEEIYAYHPVYSKQKFFLNKNIWTPPVHWKDDSADVGLNLLYELKSMGVMTGDKNLAEMCCSLQIDGEEFELLKKMQGGEEESVDSELTEILQVAEVRLKRGSKEVSLSPTNASRCLRCRRYSATENENLCRRCSDIVSRS